MKQIIAMLLLMGVSFAHVVQAQDKDSSKDVNVKIEGLEEGMEILAQQLSESLGKNLSQIATSLEGLESLKDLEKLGELGNLSFDFSDLNIPLALNGTHIHMTNEDGDDLNIGENTKDEIRELYGSAVEEVKSIDIQFEKEEVNVAIEALLENGRVITYKKIEKIDWEDSKPKE
ncbi:hypothetical protein [Algivirga pacifica]|uniref:Uncharacterized protein n=1 Tax=Algivirga pacifica TaxID=1162670 RepID=A0ABP9DLT5_9BACT